MKKISLLLILLTFSINIYSQVGINTTAPKATFDITGKAAQAGITDGILLPRLTGDQLKDKDTVYGTDQNGAIVYVTSAVTTTSTKTTGVNESGLYYYDAVLVKWKKLITDVPKNIQAFNGQRITNSGTVVNSNTVGTIDFPQRNILPTSDIGSWNAANTAFTVNKAGVYSISAGLKMAIQSGSGSSSGAMTINAGSFFIVGGSQITLGGGNYTVNCSGVLSLLLQPGDIIRVTASSGSNSWTQGSSFLHIVYSEI